MCVCVCVHVHVGVLYINTDRSEVYEQSIGNLSLINTFDIEQ